MDSPLGRVLLLPPELIETSACAEQLVDRTVLDQPAIVQEENPDGFCRSGDLVRRRADGYLEVTGRVKDVIHCGGETVAAGNLEEHVRAHPATSSAAAVALPDPHLGEKICAAVVFADAPLTLSELNDYLDQRGVPGMLGRMC